MAYCIQIDRIITPAEVDRLARELVEQNDVLPVLPRTNTMHLVEIVVKRHISRIWVKYGHLGASAQYLSTY